MEKTIKVCDICEKDMKAITTCCICSKDVCSRCSKPYVLEDKVNSSFLFGITAKSTPNTEKYSFVCKKCRNKILDKLKEISKIEDSANQKLFTEVITKITEILDPYIVADKI